MRVVTSINTANRKLTGKAFQLAIMILIAVCFLSAGPLSVSRAPSNVSAAENEMASKNLVVIPNANKVTLSATKNLLSPKGCLVTAWVGYVPPSGKPMPTANYTVNFVKDSGQGAVPPSGKSNSKGEVKVFVQWDTVIHATVQSGKTLLTSNQFTCGKNPHDRTE